MEFQAWTGQAVQQTAAVPYRWRKNTLQLCLITTSSGNWIFPKGRLASKETLIKTAQKEAWEEAGLRGTIDPIPLGCFQFPKGKQKPLIAAMLMEVSTTRSKWPEMDKRRREWLGPTQVSALLTYPSLGEVLKAACWRIEQRKMKLEAS